MKRFLMPVFMAAAVLGSASAQAHIVGLGWTFEANGDVTFDALHWHNQHAAAGALTIDGIDYAFTSFSHNTSSMTGLDGALVNASYSAYDGAGTLSVTGGPSLGGGIVDDWLHVTVSGLSAGAHTITAAAGPGGLTTWTLNGGVTTVGIVTPPPSPVSAPGTLALMGLGVAGIGFVRRKKVA